jgi:hypothetical protein
MALTITDTYISSDLTEAYAEFRPHAAANGHGAWVVLGRHGRLFDRNQAISAMTIEEEKVRPEPNQALIDSLESELVLCV